MEYLTGPAPSLRKWNGARVCVGEVSHLFRTDSMKLTLCLPQLTVLLPIPWDITARYIILAIIWTALHYNSLLLFFLSLYLLSKNSSPALPTPLNVLTNKSALPDVRTTPAVYLIPHIQWASKVWQFKNRFRIQAGFHHFQYSFLL